MSNINKEILDSKKAFIIAEAGINHNGDKSLAKDLIGAALYAGASAVKFQSFLASSLVSKSDKNQYDLLKTKELSKEAHEELFDYASSVGLVFLSSPFDKDNVDLLYNLGISAYKIASSEITNIPLLKYIAKKNKPIYLSTGMSSLFEVEEALLAILDNTDNNNITLLHCVSSYPADYASVNLRAMLTMKEVFKLPVGYSDHSLDIELPIAAVSLGASCVEKHLTIDKKLEGADHSMSLDPFEFKTMVNKIRNVELALGSGLKKPTLEELKARQSARKSLTSISEIKKGTIVKEDMFCMKRPGLGIPYKFLDIIIGKKTIRKVEGDRAIVWDDFF